MSRFKTTIAVLGMLVAMTSQCYAEDGQALFNTNCSGCHSFAARAGRSAGQITAAISGGVAAMGSLSGLSSAQISAISDYLSTPTTTTTTQGTNTTTQGTTTTTQPGTTTTTEPATTNTTTTFTTTTTTTTTTLGYVTAAGGASLTLTTKLPVFAGAGSTLVVSSGTALSGTIITLTGPRSNTLPPQSVTLTIGTQSVSIKPVNADASDAVISLRTVTVNNVSTLVPAATSGTVSVTATSNQSLMALGKTSSVITAASGGASMSQAVDSVTGTSTVVVTTGQVVLPAGSFRASTLKDGKVYAGETAQFDASGNVTQLRLGSTTGGGGAGDPLKTSNPSNVQLTTTIPDMQQATGRSNGGTLMSGIAAALSQDSGVSFDASAQNSSGVLNLSFIGGRVNALPLGNVLVDTSRADGIVVSGYKIEVTRNGLVTTIMPSVGNLTEFNNTLSSVSASSTVTLAPDGTLRAVIKGEIYIIQPSWVVTPGAGSAGLGSGTDGNLNYVDAGGNRQVLYPAFANLSELTTLLRSVDPGADVVVRGNGSITTRLAGTTFSLTPDYLLAEVPAEHANDSWWIAADRKIHIKYGGGYAQGFTVN